MEQVRDYQITYDLTNICDLKKNQNKKSILINTENKLVVVRVGTGQKGEGGQSIQPSSYEIS